MPSDACKTLENFDELLKAGLVSEEDLEDLIQECIGEQSEESRSWISLCPAYPNLKGVTCEEVDAFIDKFAPGVVADKDWTRRITAFKKEFDEAYDKMRQDVEEYKRIGVATQRDPEVFFWYDRDGDGARLRREIWDFLMVTLPEKERRELIENDSVRSPPDLIRWARSLGQSFDRDHGWRNIPTRDYVRDYLDNIKIFDRDEEYYASKDLGDRLAENIWKTMDNSEKAAVVGDDKFDLAWKDLREEDRQVAKPKILKDDRTIYVTTPRGGHEILSIFAYANDIDKRQIPSDILWPWDMWERQAEGGILVDALDEMDIKNAEKYAKMSWAEVPIEIKQRYGIETTGSNWLGKESRPVERVVFIDDIVASGEQVESVFEELRPVFGEDVPIFGVHLCHRNPEEIYHTNPIEERGREVYFIETIGIHDWGDMRKLMPIAKKFSQSEDALSGYKSLSNIEKQTIADVMYGGNRYINEARLEMMDLLLRDLANGRRPITCGFPHSIPDGASDKIMVDLYGGRVHTEKRKRRR